MTEIERQSGGGAHSPSRTPTPEERFEIADLFTAYSWALDTGDTDGLLACFEEDATFGDSGVAVTGRERIRKLVLQRYHANPIFPGRQHLVAHSVYQPLDGDEAYGWRVRSFAQVVVLRDVGAKLWWVGYYDDVVVKASGAWLFRERIANRWEGDVLGRFPAGSMASLIMERPPRYHDPV